MYSVQRLDTLKQVQTKIKGRIYSAPSFYSHLKAMPVSQGSNSTA